MMFSNILLKTLGPHLEAKEEADVKKIILYLTLSAVLSL